MNIKDGKLTVLSKEFMRTWYYYIWGQSHKSKAPLMSILAEMIFPAGSPILWAGML